MGEGIDTVSGHGWEIARSIAAVLSLLLSMAALFWARRDKQTEAQKTALSDLENKLSEDVEALKELVEARRTSTDISIASIKSEMATLGEGIKHLPTSRDIDMLQNSISTVAQAVSHQRGALESNTRMVERMNQFLMEKGT